MKSSTLLIPVSLLLTLASSRQIILGTENGDGRDIAQVSWISGNDPCVDSVFLSEENDNPCGRRFHLDGFPDLHFEGCGGDLEIWQSNNKIGDCSFAPKDVHCPLAGPVFEGKFLCAFG